MTVAILYAGVSLTKQEDRSVTKTEYPDISSPEVDFPPRLVIHRKDRAGATLTKLNPENSQTVIRHTPTGDPLIQAHHQQHLSSQRSTFTGNTSDVGKMQCSQTNSRQGSGDSGIGLQAGRLSFDPTSQQPETSSSAWENQKGEKAQSAFLKGQCVFCGSTVVYAALCSQKFTFWTSLSLYCCLPEEADQF